MHTVKVHMLAFMEGDKVRNVNIPDEEMTGNLHDDLERIFYYGQNDFQPQNICSVSVGDVAEYAGFRRVEGVGWKELTQVEFDEYVALSVEERMRSRYPKTA